MALLKCKECEKEISINSSSCPNCGSKKAFKGYVFNRKQLVEMGLSSTGDFLNYQNRGGRIEVLSKKSKYLIIAFIVIMLSYSYYKDSTEPREIVKFEDKEYLVRVSTKELLSSLDKIEKYQYDELSKIYSSIASKEPEFKIFKEKQKYYEDISLNSSNCIYYVNNSDKSKLNFPDTYELDRSFGYWIDTHKYYYQHSFKAKNAFGVPSTLTTKNTCTYSKDFSTFNITTK
ncbi:hypothetical protein [Aliarcobacter cryaerophilus]|uniref:hypothetical protein n=1 Tax=Aliarcobacter cryaerophilus TaxID=28198 RepID=UPI003DA27888